MQFQQKHAEKISEIAFFEIKSGRKYLPPIGIAIKLDRPFATSNIEIPFEMFFIPTTSYTHEVWSALFTPTKEK